MKKVLAFILGLMAPVLAGATFECEYGASCDIPIRIYEPDGVDFATTTAVTIAAGDLSISCNDSTETAGTGAASEAGTYTFVVTLSAAQTSCERLVVGWRDADATALYLASHTEVDTCGNASAAREQCREGLSTVAATDIVSSGPINTAGGAVSQVTTVNGFSANAQNEITVASEAANTSQKLDQLTGAPWDGTFNPGSVFGSMVENSAGLRYTEKSLEQAPTGSGGGGDANVVSWNGVLLSTTNPLPNAVPGGNGGLPTVDGSGNLTQETTVAAYNSALDFNATQKASINTEMTAVNQNMRLHELAQSPLIGQPGANSLFGDLTQDNGSGVQQFTANALANTPSAALDAEALRKSLGGFGTTIQTVNSQTEFVLAAGPSNSNVLNDLFTVVLKDQGDSGNPNCHRQITEYLGGSRLLTIPSACSYTVADGDEVVIMPNGAGDVMATITVNDSGQVETDLAQTLESGISVGCAMAAVNAVQTGEQIVTSGGTIYEYKSRDGAVTRVQATRSASGRSQATITCPPGL